MPSGARLSHRRSIALGWSGVGATHQLYLTPKLFRMNGWRLND